MIVWIGKDNQSGIAKIAIVNGEGIQRSSKDGRLEINNVVSLQFAQREGGSTSATV